MGNHQHSSSKLDDGSQVKREPYKLKATRNVGVHYNRHRKAEEVISDMQHLIQG
jgi:hypothetical protein